MMDREKVIDGIEETISYLRCHVGTLIERLIQHQNDTIDLLKEQEEQIEQLEYDLAVTQNNLNYFVNGND